MIAHTQLEVAIEGTTFTREGLFKLFRGQLQVFVEQVLIFVFHRLPILAIGATEIVGHVIGRSAGNLCELEVVDRFSIVFVVQILESQAIGGRGVRCLHNAGADRARLNAGAGCSRLNARAYGPGADGGRWTRTCLRTHLRWYDRGSLQERLPITLAEFRAGTVAIAAFWADDFVSCCRRRYYDGGIG